MGHNFALTPSADLIVFAMPQFVHVRGTTNDEGDSITESDNIFGSAVGFQVASGRVHAGASARFFSKAFDEKVDPEFGVSLGILLGR